MQTAINRRLGEELALLYEDRLLARGKMEELLGFYRTELEVVTTDQEWVEKVRSAATKLVLRGRQPGLALRLLRRSLEHAYVAKLTDVPGHLASWELLLGHARRMKSTIEIMPLVVQALGQTLSDDERVYLSRVGFEVSWRDARDVEAARPYATAVAELVPDHPGVCEFMSNELAALIGDGDDDLLAALANIGDEPAIEPVATVASAPPVAVAPPPQPQPQPQPQPPPLPPRAVRPAVAPPPPAASAPAVVPAAAIVTAAPPAIPTVSTAAPPPIPPAPAVPRDGGARMSTPTGSAAAPKPSSGARVVSLIPPAALAALRGSGTQVGVPAVPPLRAGAAARAARIVVPIDLEVSVAGGPAFAAVARDISTTGLFIATGAELDLQTIITLDLHLPGETALAEARYSVSARVVRRTDAGYGVVLVEPSPALVAAITAVAALA